MLNIRTKILVCGYLVQGADFWGSYVLLYETTVGANEPQLKARLIEVLEELIKVTQTRLN